MIEEKMYTCTDFLKKLKSQIISIYIYSKIQYVAFNVSCSCKFIEMKFYFSISFVHFAFKYSKVFVNASFKLFKTRSRAQKLRNGIAPLIISDLWRKRKKSISKPREEGRRRNEKISIIRTRVIHRRLSNFTSRWLTRYFQICCTCCTKE